MSTKIETMITEAKDELQKVQEDYNRNLELIQQLQQQNVQLQGQGQALASRVNTLTELSGLGNAAFQSVEDEAAAPAEATKEETETEA